MTELTQSDMNRAVAIIRRVHVVEHRLHVVSQPAINSGLKPEWLFCMLCGGVVSQPCMRWCYCPAGKDHYDPN